MNADVARARFATASRAGGDLIDALKTRADAGPLKAEAVSAVLSTVAKDGITVRGIRELASFAQKNWQLFTDDGRQRVSDFCRKEASPHVRTNPVKTLAASPGLPDPVVAPAYRARIEWRAVDPTAASGGVDFTHPAQGWLPDCFVISAFIAVARQQPDAIKNCLNLDDEGRPRRNQRGNLTATFFGGSGAHTLELDEDLPTVDGGLIYAHADDPSVLWPALLEKAYTMWEQGDAGYAGYRGGEPVDVMVALTGGTGDVWNLDEDWSKKDARKLRRKLVASWKEGAAMAIGTREDADRSLGLVPGHAYAIVGLGKDDKLGPWVELQNPFGVVEPGDDVDDGRFKVPLSALGYYFEDVYVASRP
jgi:hypothetical protein